MSASEGRRLTALDDAKTFLLTTLAGGPRRAADLQTEAAIRGLSWITVKRAKDVIGVQSRKVGLQSGWEWSMIPFEENPYKR